jgi:hypothetical protein
MSEGGKRGPVPNLDARWVLPPRQPPPTAWIRRAVWAGRRAVPPVARRVVFVHVIGGRPALDEAADDVGLVI